MGRGGGLPGCNGGSLSPRATATAAVLPPHDLVGGRSAATPASVVVGGGPERVRVPAVLVGGNIVEAPILGGLRHDYRRAA